MRFFGENALFRKSATTFDRPELWTLKRIDGHNVGGAAVKAGEVTEAKLANPFVGKNRGATARGSNGSKDKSSGDAARGWDW